MKNAFLKNLAITGNVSEAFCMNGNVAVIKITTSESSEIVLLTSADGVDYDVNENFSKTVNGRAEFNVADLVVGQFIKLQATSGTMTVVKVLG